MIGMRPFLSMTLMLVCLHWSGTAYADDHMDIEYAEIQPLAPESMLLDVTRIGHRIVAVGERGHVIYSDNGEDWTQAEHVPTRSTLTTVITVDDRLWAAGHDTVIITSGDGGRNWSRQFFDPDRQQAVMDLLFTDSDNGVAIGSYGLYLVTSDGGRSWEDRTIDPENDYHLNAMVRLPNGRRFIAGEAGLSYRSMDDGESWELLDLPYQGSMWGAIEYLDGCIVFFGLRGNMQMSCDSGDNWIEWETGTEASLSGAAVHEGQLVIAGNSGTVLTRGTGALTAHTHSSGVDFAAVLPMMGGRFLLVGEEGVHLFPEANGAGDDQ